MKKNGLFLRQGENLPRASGPAECLACSSGVSEHKLAAERMRGLLDCQLAFRNDTEANIDSLVAMCGKTMGATCSLYNRLDGTVLCTLDSWQAPPGFNKSDAALGHICYDVIRTAGLEPLVIRNLPSTSYAESDPNVAAYGLLTYVGVAVMRRGLSIGSLCAVYQRDANPSPGELDFIRLVGMAIGAEEERRLALEKIAEQARDLKTLSDTIPAVVHIKDRDLVYRAANQAFCDLVKTAPEDIAGKTDFDFFSRETAEKFREFDRDVMDSGTAIRSREMRLPSIEEPDGPLVEWVEIHKTPIVDGQGMVIGAVSMALNITTRKRVEERIAKLLAEKEMILHEVNHRIKNNMATMTSLLTLQSQASKNPAVVEALQDAQGRLRTMAILYDKLYRMDDVREMPLKAYLPPLVADIVGQNTSLVRIKTDVVVGDFILGAKRLASLGILVNELLTNSLKHAFTGRTHGLLSVSAMERNGRVTIVVEDDGIGLPEAVTFESEKGLGMRLIDMLAQQMDGTIRVERGRGTRFVIALTL